MKSFDELLKITDILLGPEGCPWDREQTMKTVRNNILEEVCEVIEAINVGDNEEIKEELGDLFYNVLFLSKLAEKEKRCLLEQVLEGIKNKLIRRHPHVFGKEKANSADYALKHWEASKEKESKVARRKSALSGIPKRLPALARTQKVIKKTKKKGFSIESKRKIKDFQSEEELGEILFSYVLKAEELDVDAEHSLKAVLSKYEKSFRQFEK